jgi:hypothetical protein
LLCTVGRNSHEATAWRLGPAGKTARATRGNACGPRWGLAGGKVLPTSTGGAAENGRRGGVQWRRGGSGGRQRAERVPGAPVREGEDGVSSNLGMMKLGGRSPERGKTAAALGEIRHEGEAFGCRRQQYGRGNGGEGGGAREGDRSGVGDGARMSVSGAV